MEKITVVKSDEGYNIDIQANDDEGDPKDSSSYTTYKLQMWEPGLDPDTDANLVINDTITWDSDGSDGLGYYTLQDGDVDIGAVYHARLFLAKTGVEEKLKVFAIIVPNPTWYITIAEVKSELELDNDDYDDWFGVYCDTVTDLIDVLCDREFATTDEARYFDGDTWLIIPDLLSVTSIKLDLDADGTYEETMVAADYILYPLNKTPKTKLVISSRADRSYSSFANGVQNGVEIDGVWGYKTRVPKGIRMAALIQVTQWFKLRESGFTGIIGSAEFGATQMKKGLDPNIRLLLDKYIRGEAV